MLASEIRSGLIRLIEVTDSVMGVSYLLPVMTASSSKNSRKKAFAYYRCQSKKGCCQYAQKSISDKTMHAEFTQQLKNHTPSQKLLELAKLITLDVWEQKVKKPRQNS